MSTDGTLSQRTLLSIEVCRILLTKEGSLACSIIEFSFRGTLESSILCATGEPFWIQKPRCLPQCHFNLLSLSLTYELDPNPNPKLSVVVQS